MKLSEPHLNGTRHRAVCVCVRAVHGTPGGRREEGGGRREGGEGGREGGSMRDESAWNQLAWDASPQMFTPYLSNT